MTYVAGPIANFEAIRRDPTAHLIGALDKAGSLGERARGAVQVGRTRGTSDLPNLVRAGHGPGWALAGDAGLVMDPITGLGIGHGLRDAELLSHAVLKGLGGASDLPGALTRYEKQRNRETKPAFNWTLDVATLRGVNEIEEQLVQDHRRRRSGGLTVLRHAHWGRSDAVVLQSCAPDSVDRCEGFSTACARSFALSGAESAG